MLIFKLSILQSTRTWTLLFLLCFSFVFTIPSNYMTRMIFTLILIPCSSFLKVAFSIYKFVILRLLVFWIWPFSQSLINMFSVFSSPQKSTSMIQVFYSFHFYPILVYYQVSKSFPHDRKLLIAKINVTSWYSFLSQSVLCWLRLHNFQYMISILRNCTWWKFLLLIRKTITSMQT